MKCPHCPVRTTHGCDIPKVNISRQLHIKSMFVDRTAELRDLTERLHEAEAGVGRTVVILGETGVGKTTLMEKLISEAKKRGFLILRGACVESAGVPFLPIKEALESADLSHLLTWRQPHVIAAYAIHRETGLLLGMAERERSGLDPDIFAGMLSAVQSFVKDSLSFMGDARGYLNTLGYGEYRILITRGDYLDVVLVIRGEESEALKYEVQTDLEIFESAYARRLETWSGEVGEIPVEDMVRKYVDSERYTGTSVEDAQSRREAMYDNVAHGLLMLSQSRPLVIAIDDVHWADADTLAFIHYLSRTLRNARALILCTARSEEKSHLLEERLALMSREDLVKRIELTRFNLQTVREFIDARLSPNIFPERFYERMYGETGGNPFFVEELLNTLVAEGRIYRDGNIWRARGEVYADITERMRDVISRRLRYLSEEEREVLEFAAVLGERFHSSTLEPLTGLPRLRLLRILGNLERKHGLIRHMENGMYAFHHVKIRDVVYSEMLPEMRAEIHRMAAEIFKRRGAEPGEVAVHLHAAGDPEAVEFLVRAAERAMEMHLWGAAARYYEMAAELAEEPRWYMLSAGDAYYVGGDMERAAECYGKFADGDPEAACKLAWALARAGRVREAEALVERWRGSAGRYEARITGALGAAYTTVGQGTRAIPLLRNYISYLEREGDSEALPEAHLILGRAFHISGNQEKALEHYNMALSLATKSGQRRMVAAALVNVGIVEAERGRIREAVKSYTRALEMAMELGDKAVAARALNNLGVAHHSAGEVERALEYYERALRINEELGSYHGLAIALGNIAGIYNQMGETERAMEYHRRALETYERMGDVHGMAVARLDMGVVLYTMGRFDEAEEMLQSSLAVMEEAGDISTAAFVRLMLGAVKGMKGDLVACIEAAEDAIRVFTSTGERELVAYCLMLRGRAELLTGKREGVKTLREAEEMFADMGSKNNALICACLRALLGGESVLMGCDAGDVTDAETLGLIRIVCGLERGDMESVLSGLGELSPFVPAHAVAVASLLARRVEIDVEDVRRRVPHLDDWARRISEILR